MPSWSSTCEAPCTSSPGAEGAGRAEGAGTAGASEGAGAGGAAEAAGASGAAGAAGAVVTGLIVAALQDLPGIREGFGKSFGQQSLIL